MLMDSIDKYLVISLELQLESIQISFLQTTFSYKLVQLLELFLLK